MQFIGLYHIGFFTIVDTRLKLVKHTSKNFN